jgi:hypothetical protein
MTATVGAVGPDHPRLTAGQSYTFKIAARSVVGTGLLSAASNAVTPT